MRKLNLAFMAVLIAVLALLSGVTYGVHELQVRRNVSMWLGRARHAEHENDLETAEQSLEQYLNLRREDGAAWKWYARVVDRRRALANRETRASVFLVHEQALRFNPADTILERRCADLAMELGRFTEAQHHLANLLDRLPKDARGEPMIDQGPAAAELEELSAQCDRSLTHFDEAEIKLARALRYDPHRVVCYEQWARLLRIDLRRIEAADAAIRDMVKKNPESGRAYACRWRYARGFLESADSRDVETALRLSADDPEVLLTAAMASEERQDAASARAHWEKGSKLDPKRVVLTIGRARLETRENHLDRAEAILRHGLQANPVLDLAFELAENLILQDKVEGQDQAADYIGRLRSAGLGEGYVGYLEGRVLFQRKQWAEAIRRLETARNALRSDARLTAVVDVILVECYGRVGDQERRLAALRQAAEGTRAPESLRIELGRAIARTGKSDEALAVLLPLVARRPELRLDILRLSIQKNLMLPQHQRRWQAVERQLDEAQKVLPSAVEDITALRADVLDFQGKPDAARAILEKAIRCGPKSVRCRIALAEWLQRRTDDAQAKEVLDQAEKDLGTSPSLTRAWVGFWSRRGGDDARRAIAQLAGSRTEIPVAERPAVLSDLAAAFLRLGDSQRAAGLWSELSKLQPDNLEVLSLRAHLAVAAHDESAVEEIVSQMKRVEGEEGTLWRHAKAAFQIEEIGRSDPITSEKARNAASNLVSEIITRRGDWWGGVALRGRLSDMGGKPEDAVRDYLRAVDLGATQPALARRLVGLLYQLKQTDQIDQVVQKLAERGMAQDELKLAAAVTALRRQDYDRAIAVAREVIPESSNSYSDQLFLSRMLLTAGRTAEADKPLSRAMQLAPAVPEVWVDRVRFLVEANRTTEIPQVLDQAARALRPEQVPAALALCQSIAGNDEEASKLFESALKLHPDDPGLLRTAAGHYIKVLKLGEAQPLIAKLLDPSTESTAADRAWARRSVGLSLMKSGDQRQIDRAIALIDENLKDNQFNFEDQRALAVLLSMKFGRRTEAIRQLEALDRSRLLTVADRFLLARLYRDERDWPKCQAQLLGLVQERKPDPSHLAEFVTLLVEQGQLSLAERWLGQFKPTNRSQNLVFVDLKCRLLRARNHDAAILTMLREYTRGHPDQIGVVAELFERYGHLKNAERAYRDFVAQNSQEPHRVLALARFLARHNRVQEALVLCEEARKTSAPEALASASVAILASGENVTDKQCEEVGSWLEDALKRQSSSTRIRMNLANLRTMQGRYDQTESIYREVLSVNLDNVEALNNLAWVLAHQPGREHEALELIDRAIEIAGSNPTLVDTRAVIYLQLGKTDLALEDVRTALAISPAKSVLYFHLARALEMAGNPTEAREAFRAAEQRGLKVESIDPLEREIFRKVREQLPQS